MIRPAGIDDFAGTWRVSRVIQDAKTNQTSQFRGEATVLPEQADVLRYAEQGTLTLSQGTEIRAERRYLWRATQTGIDVFFEDDRFFHHIGLGTPTPRAHHSCPPDAYHVQYEFAAWPNWSTVWHVRGPRKDYGMTTHYQR